VDGGYTQQDVVEVSRCFTGWAYNPLNGQFLFTPQRHDNGEKVVLGQQIAAGGIKDGEMVLDLIAGHPSTAKHIATKLCRRFIADDPPPAAIEWAAKTFEASGGDLRKVVECIVTSPEFFSPQAYRAKIKSPFEFGVSAIRATGGTIDLSGEGLNSAMLRCTVEGSATLGYGQELVSKAKRKSLNWHIFEMGQPLYAYQAPTGYPEDSRKWVSSGALISRLNFTLALTGQTVADVTLSPQGLTRNLDIDQPEKVMDQLLKKFVPGDPSPATRDTLLQQYKGKESTPGSTVNVPQMAALILGSPEFQRR